MAKLMCSRTVTSLSPDTRNGHKPSITVQFWGDRSLAMRGTSRGPGKKLEYEPIEVKKDWWVEQIKVDPVTLKAAKPKAKKVNWTPKKDKTITLDTLIAKFEGRRTHD